VNNKAPIPNPSLKPLSFLVGEWELTGAHPLVPGETLHGQARFEWIESGAYLKMSSVIEHPSFPAGMAIFGSDDQAGKIYALYFDERKISRKYDFEITNDGWKWWRNDPKFSQRFTVKISEEGHTMVGKGEMCRDGHTWEKDLDITYIRTK
jgi:hypothetical protein